MKMFIFFTEVGENDLLNFTDTNMVTLPQNQAIAESALPLETEKITETPEPEVTIIPEEKEEPEKKSNNSGTILLMLLVLAGVCGAYYYWKFMKGEILLLIMKRTRTTMRRKKIQFVRMMKN